MYVLCVHVCGGFTSQRVTTEKEERERGKRLTEKGGLGGPGRRWLWEADVPAELFSVFPASSETVTEVCRANRLPQNWWLDLGKQMLKNAFHAKKCQRTSTTQKNSNSLKNCVKVLNPPKQTQKEKKALWMQLT